MKHKDLIRILKDHDFVFVRNSSHQIYNNGTLTVAVPHRLEFSRGLVRRILQQSGLTKEQIKELI